MTRPFEGIRIIDATHVLAGPFAAYQLGVLGAEVIKVEHPQDPDQSRLTGTDRALNRKLMGTSYLTQASNKRSLTLDLKQEEGREIFRRLVARADVLVENYRPGAFAALGLGYEAMAALNPRLIYCSISAFGQQGPRGEQTAYDHVIQATSGLMATTGTPEVNPIKFGAPAVDYATGTMGAFALSAALFQREKTGRGQYIDLAMLGVAMMLMGSHLTGYLRNGVEPKPSGNKQPFATNSCYPTKDGLLMLGASNLRQQRRLWLVLEQPEMAKRDNEARESDREREAALVGVLRMLDLDDLGAEHAELIGGERARQHVRRVDDADTLERPGHAALLSFCFCRPGGGRDPLSASSPPQAAARTMERLRQFVRRPGGPRPSPG